MRFEDNEPDQPSIPSAEMEWDEDDLLQIGGNPDPWPVVLNEEESARFMAMITAAPRPPTERMLRALENYR